MNAESAVRRESIGLYLLPACGALAQSAASTPAWMNHDLEQRPPFPPRDMGTACVHINRSGVSRQLDCWLPPHLRQ
jgi:hypothetical protein